MTYETIAAAYYATVRRAAGSHYTRSERLRRQGAARRWRVQVARWRASPAGIADRDQYKTAVVAS
jgi:hypothetical protein